MSDNFAKSPKDIKQIKFLLGKNIPSYRQAYSDRTAWLMACLSEIAYIKFNPVVGGAQQQRFVKEVEKFLRSAKKSSLTRKKSIALNLIGMFVHDHDKAKKELVAELGVLDLKLNKTFDNHGTQAILVSNKNFAVLAFRGTENTSLRDIKTDVDAKMVRCETGGMIHTGFRDAFNHVYLDIQNALNKDVMKNKPLFITGHSLGGALATIAAKNLSHVVGIAACYTYGSPRVGNDEWIENIKTPVYRVVNAADCVTMLPPGDEIVTVFSWLFRGIAWFRIPGVTGVAKFLSKWLLPNYGGYRHCGDMRYMTNCKRGRYDNVELLYSVSIFRRIAGWHKKKGSWGKFFADHSISVYRKKLMVIAVRRNG